MPKESTEAKRTDWLIQIVETPAAIFTTADGKTCLVHKHMFFIKGRLEYTLPLTQLGAYAGSFSRN